MRTARKAGLALWFAAMGGIACLAQGASPKAAGEDTDSRIAGSWRGNSVCMVKGSPCRDEVNVYRFLKVAGRPGSFSGTASKVVEGRETVMGSGEWTYDSREHVLEGKTSAIRMVIDGKRMEGDLALADGTVYRRISLKKDD